MVCGRGLLGSGWVRGAGRARAHQEYKPVGGLRIHVYVLKIDNDELENDIHRLRDVRRLQLQIATQKLGHRWREEEAGEELRAANHVDGQLVLDLREHLGVEAAWLIATRYTPGATPAGDVHVETRLAVAEQVLLDGWHRRRVHGRVCLQHLVHVGRRQALQARDGVPESGCDDPIQEREEVRVPETMGNNLCPVVRVHVDRRRLRCVRENPQRRGRRRGSRRRRQRWRRVICQGSVAWVVTHDACVVDCGVSLSVGTNCVPPN